MAISQFLIRPPVDDVIGSLARKQKRARNSILTESIETGLQHFSSLSKEERNRYFLFLKESGSGLYYGATAELHSRIADMAETYKIQITDMATTLAALGLGLDIEKMEFLATARRRR